MTVDGAWEGDPESKPCEMGGGPLVDYGVANLRGGNEHGGKTLNQAVKLALTLATGTAVTHVCGSKAQGEAMKRQIEDVLRQAGCLPVAKYMKKFSVHVNKRSK